MTCEGLKDILLTDYLDGELSEDVRELIDEHLKECVSCRELLSAAKLKDDLLAEEFDREPSMLVWARIEEELDRPAFSLEPFFQGVRQWINPPRVALAFASVVFLVIMISSVVKRPYQEIASPVSGVSASAILEEVLMDDYFEEQNGLDTVVEYLFEDLNGGVS